MLTANKGAKRAALISLSSFASLTGLTAHRNISSLPRRQASTSASETQSKEEVEESPLAYRLGSDFVLKRSKIPMRPARRVWGAKGTEIFIGIKPIIEESFNSQLKKLHSSYKVDDILNIFQITDPEHIDDLKESVDIIIGNNQQTLLFWLFDIFLIQAVVGRSVDTRLMNHLICNLDTSENTGTEERNITDISILISRSIDILLRESRQHVAYYNLKTLITNLFKISQNSEQEADLRPRYLSISKTLNSVISTMLIKVETDAEEINYLKKVFKLLSSYNKSLTFIRDSNPENAHLVTPCIISYSNSVKILQLASTLGEDTSSQRLKYLVTSEMGYYLAVLNDYLKIDKNSIYLDMQTLNYNKLLDTYLFFCYKFIEERLKAGDEAAAYRLMWELKPFHNKSYNSNIQSPNNNPSNGYYYYQLLSRLVSSFSLNTRYRDLVDEIVSNLSVDACRVSPKLMHALLLHSSKTKNFELSQILSNQYTDDTLGLSTRFSPAQLGALLTTELEKQNFTKVSEIMKFAKSNMISFGVAEFNSLIKSTMLTQGDETAWQLIKEAPNYIAVSAYLTYLNCMVNVGNMDYDKINYMYKKMLSCSKRVMKAHNIWRRFIAIFFKYTTRNFPLQQSIMIYKNASRKVKNEEANASLGLNSPTDISYGISNGRFTEDNNPFMLRLNKIQLHLGSPERVIILRTIYYRALSLRDSKKSTFGEDIDDYQKIIKWGADALAEESIDKQAVIADLKRGSHKNLRKIGLSALESEDNSKEKTLEALLLENKTQFINNWFPAQGGKCDPVQ